MPSLREHAKNMRVDLQASERYVGPPVLVAAAEPDAEVVVLTDAERNQADVGPTTTLQIDRSVLEEQLTEYSGSLAKVVELVSADSSIFELRRDEENPGSFRVGRDDDNDIPLDDATVSGQHATLDWRHGRWVVTDLGSSNGTYVNTKAVAPNDGIALVSGDCVRFGQRVFYFLSGQELAFFFKQWL